LAELDEYLDEKTSAEVRSKLEAHVAECPNCWVICDTTRKTIRVYQGMKPCSIPDDVHSRLMKAFEMKCASRKT
jgi:hypothetical protein